MGRRMCALLVGNPSFFFFCSSSMNGTNGLNLAFSFFIDASIIPMPVSAHLVSAPIVLWYLIIELN